MIVIALRQLHATKPGEPIDVRPEDAKLLVQIGFAKYPDPQAEPLVAPPVSPTRRRSYRRRDLAAES